jgi:putative DNA primase/helicase
MPIEPTWIQFKDKIYDIKTGNCFDASPDYFVTNPIPWKLHNNNYEETPIIDKIFTEWVGEKFVRTLYEIVAYCLLPSYPLNRMFCFLGAGMNGKSKFLELLKRFVGTENVCSTELDTLLASRFEVTRLHKKLVCQMGETNFNEMQKTSIIKKLTGGDLMGFEYKNKTPFEDKNYAKIIIATNNLPTTTDKTLGFYRRWLIVDFPNIFSEQKDILEDIPDEEYESLALKCTGILHNLLKNRRFTNEGSVEKRMERYEAKADFLQKFLDEFTIEAPDGTITCSDFAKKFSAWCFENRHRQMADNTIGKKMKEKSIEKGRKYASWLFDGKGVQIWVWEGRKWKK